LNVADENDTAREMNPSKLKAIASGVLTQYERKGQDPYDEVIFTKLVFAVNNLPKSQDTSEGFARKLMIIPFEKTFTDKEKDPDLIDELLKELPGIFVWALKGLKRLVDNKYKFSSSKKIKSALKGYLKGNDPFRDFVDRCLIISSEETKEGERPPQSLRISKLDMYAVFYAWLRLNPRKEKIHLTRGEIVDGLRTILKAKNIFRGQETSFYKSGGEIYFPFVQFSEKGLEVKDNIYYTEGVENYKANMKIKID
jgi:putative DNA primase/helicase